MNKKGFTLIEVISVIAILSIAIVLIGVNFFNQIDSRKSFEDKELYKYLIEAALIYAEVEGYPGGEVTAEELSSKGYIDSKFEILDDVELKYQKIIISKTNGEYTACVKVGGGCVDGR